MDTLLCQDKGDKIWGNAKDTEGGWQLLVPIPGCQRGHRQQWHRPVLVGFVLVKARLRTGAGEAESRCEAVAFNANFTKTRCEVSCWQKAAKADLLLTKCSIASGQIVPSSLILVFGLVGWLVGWFFKWLSWYWSLAASYKFYKWYHSFSVSSFWFMERWQTGVLLPWWCPLLHPAPAEPRVEGLNPRGHFLPLPQANQSQRTAWELNSFYFCIIFIFF